jgi:TRAP-type mannitol/chloroaromatic compound transport system substrate-binding protein
LRNAADFEGKKIRGFGIEAEWFNSLGAEPVSIGGAEIYTSLATGVVDAVRWGDEFQNLQQGLHEVAGFYIKPAIHPAPNNHILVNQATWDSMPADIQAIIEGAAKLTSMKYLTLTAMKKGPSRAELEAAGMEFVTIPADEWSTMQASVRDIWAGYADHDERTARAVALLQEFLTELGR